MRNLVYGLGETSLAFPDSKLHSVVDLSNDILPPYINTAPGAVGGGLAVFGAVLEVLNSERKPGLSKTCSSRRATPAWLKNLRE